MGGCLTFVCYKTAMQQWRQCVNLQILRARLVRDRCLACGKLPNEESQNTLWTSFRNDLGERIFNLCSKCSSTFARAYQKQQAQQQAGQNNPPLSVGAK